MHMFVFHASLWGTFWVVVLGTLLGEAMRNRHAHTHTHAGTHTHTHHMHANSRASGALRVVWGRGSTLEGRWGDEGECALKKLTRKC
jgi:hypothetical protein